ncbi:MAG: tRNA pseudouridine synthase A [Promethearchaeota archaeon]
MNEKKYLIRFYYIGKKKYHGSQRQAHDVLTIEQCLIEALIKRNYIHELRSAEFELASRTDRGVSARAACFSFISMRRPILMELNSVLPPSIGLYSFCEVPKNFSSRHDAIMRHYKYIVPISLSILKKENDLNLDMMRQACNALKGRHDFVNFHKWGNEKVITLRDLEVASMEVINDFIIFDFQSRGFLRQQIRRMVKKILEVGMGLIKFDDFLELFNSEKKISYQPADPEGLILWDILYDPEFKFQQDSKSVERMKRYFRIHSLKYQHRALLFSLLEQSNARK